MEAIFTLLRQSDANVDIKKMSRDGACRENSAEVTSRGTTVSDPTKSNVHFYYSPKK